MKLSIRKKKGSTIVEIIAAIAILLLGMEAVSITFSTSSKIWQNHNKKLDTSTFNQTICQNLRQKDKKALRDYFDGKASGIPKTVSIFIYFNDYEEAVAAVANEAGYLNPVSATYSACKTANSSGKKYGALIYIEDEKQSQGYYDLYRIDVKVWDMKESANYESVSSFYIGG